MMIENFKERYLNPQTDFGFKLLFGTELNKDLLMGFLNALFQGQQVIENVTYLNGEHLGDDNGSCRAIFDVFCENDKGEKFIVEMQNVFQQFFKDRSVYYSTFPIREQAVRGDWDFRLKAVYTIGILNFVFDEDRDSENYYHHEVKLMDVERKTVFFDKLTFIYLELPKFKKTEDELETPFEKWMYVLRNLSRLLKRPAALQERVFTRLFEAAEIGRFTPEQLRDYETSVKSYRDIVNAVNTARMEGREEGIEVGIEKGRVEGIAEEKRKNARNMKSLDISPEVISQITGLSVEEINQF